MTASIAYLINAYPKVSHSFIRREIAALEALGVPVARFSIRPPGELVDPDDRTEAAHTTVLLAGGAKRLALALLTGLIQHPLAWLRTARLVLHIGIGSDRGLPRHLVYFAEACLLARALARSGATHVHAHFGTNPADVAMYTGSLTGLPYSFTVHGPEEFDRPLALRLREKIQRARFVVAISSFGRSQLYRWIDYTDWHKVRVVHCGLDHAYLDHEPEPVPEVTRMVNIGRLCEQKGQILLVQAAAALDRQGYEFELVLIGDGELRGPIERLIAEHRLEGKVIITGWQSSDQIRSWLRSSRALVMASFAEGLPVVIMEALALGRPVISTTIAGIPELLTTECGWLVPAGSVEALAAAMVAALDRPCSKLTTLGQIGAARVRQRHDAAREADKLAQLFTGGAPESNPW